MKRLLLLMGVALLALAACTPAQVSLFQAMLGVPPQDAGPLGGQIATPPPSSITLPTEAPTVVGPLATLTAVAAMIATPDINATPYTITMQGRPIFIEFQARW